MSCLIITPKIKELAAQFPSETVDSIKNLVSLWQERYSRNSEDIPTELELSEFMKDLRNSTSSSEQTTKVDKRSEFNPEAFSAPQVTALEEQQKVELDFSVKTRRDRVTLLAGFFSNEVSNALKEMQDSLDTRISSAKGVEKLELEESLQALNRYSAIKEYTPAGIFNRVLSIFKDYTEDTDEGRIKVEFDNINSMNGADRFTDEQKLAAAKSRATYKNMAYQKVIDNFRILAEEAGSILIMSEGIRIDPNYLAPSDANLNDDTPEGDSVLDTQAAESVQEEAYKDGWMANFKQVSSHESLSQAVRKIISQVPKLDYRGMYEKDDLGFPRYLDANYVHATLIDKLKDMINAQDMISLMQSLEKNKPWVGQVIDLIQNDEILFSQFYQDFRKDFLPYWIQKKKTMPDGTVKWQTVAVNKPEGTYYLIDSWRDNYEQGTQLDDNSIYEKNGDINKDNAEKGLKWTETLNNMFVNLDTQARLNLLEQNHVWNSLVKLLHMIGVDANPAVLKNALTNIKTAKGVTFTDPIMLLLPQLNVIFSGVKKGEIKSETKEDGTQKEGDLINTFGSAYNSIALMLADVTEDAIESSVWENGKSQYSHVTPSYLGKLIKQLKDVSNDPDRFQQFIENEFKQYEWFFKNGHWRSDWIEQLANSSEMRKGLNHKVVLNSNKVEYQDWDDLDYTRALLTEYWGDPEKSNTDVQWAWYHVPILSDTTSAEFIRFRKYVSGKVMDEEGNYRTYNDIILDKLTDLVNQEYDRIMLVRERNLEYQNGNPAISPITNYDIIKDSIGGAEFKFLTDLNHIRYDTGESFLDRLTNLQKNGTGQELKEFIREALNEVMNTGFEEAYREWAKVGLLDELPTGEYQHLPFRGGQIAQNLKTAQSLVRAKEVLGGNLWTTDMELLLKAYNNNTPVSDRNANELFENIDDLLTYQALRGEVELKETQAIVRNLKIKNNAKDALREYYWNSKLATSQIIELTTSDLAFYKNEEDFQKRYKEVHAPALRLNTQATFKGERIGRDLERTIYLQDDEIESSVIDDIKTVLDEKVKKGEMSKIDRDNIVYKFKNVNVADAQAYRSLSSYRAILGMSGQWTDEMQQAYENFKAGNWNMADFNTIWQTKKPYVYTQVSNSSGIEGHTSIKTPVQHKNSEFLLLAMHDLIAGPLGKSSKLIAINKFMEEHNIDVVQFESTTKVGKQEAIDINKVNTEKDVLNILGQRTGITTGSENPNVVHTISYEDYGIQTATPEHSIDAVQLIGTQIRKLITADIADDAIININGKSLSKKEWLNLYNAINTENILQAFTDANDLFNDPKKVEEVLLEEIRGNQRYGMDMVKACTLDENDNFNIPLFDPVQSQKVQTLLNSVIKSRITKQKIRGGALIQVSDYGLTDELHIVFDGEGENKSIKFLECYMPAYSREFYEPLMDPETHQLDITKLPDSLRKLIGYRVPTEDKYSMAPLYIKGFLPQQNGSAIMLPAEITTLSGSDFDVDKMFIMLPEFTIQKYDKRKARTDFAKGNEAFNQLMSQFTNSQLAEDILSEDPESFKSWFEANKGMYKLSEPLISKVEYNTNKLPQENSLKARNNMLIDMMYGVLTNADTSGKILNPGGFDYQKRAARIVTILNDSYESDIQKALEKLGIELNKTIKKGEREVAASISSYLFDLDLDTLTKLAEQTKNNLDPLSPRTQVQLHQQNMTGAKLIGIYANHNANHALMQHTELSLSTENGSFILNGKRLTSLHDIMNQDKEFISKNNAGFLAASVDNVKDPVLAGINQNTFTADASMLLSRLGYNPTEIGLLMAQPVIKDITQTYFRTSREGKGKDMIINEVLNKYREKAGLVSDLSYDNYKNNMFLIEDLADNILISKEVEAMFDNRNTTDFRKVEYYQKQTAVGFLFKRIMSSADALGTLVQATRSDTQGGGAGPTIADSIIKVEKVQDLLKNIAENAKFPLIGANVLSDSSYSGLDTNTIREELLKSPLPYLQAFYSLGLKQSEVMLSEYFPQFKNSFNDVIEELRSMTKRGKLDVKTMNNVYNDLLTYIMSQNEFFGEEFNNETNETLSYKEKRHNFINNFPTYFKEVVTNNSDIADLEFIKRLKVIRANDNNPVDTVVFSNVGQLSPTLRERYMRNWASLLYMSNPEAQKLALNLFRYSYFRNGFAFGPSTFIHLAPVAIRTAIPDYISTLRRLLDTDYDYSQFIDQYIYNHLDNRKLVPEIPDTAQTSFLDENKNLKDTVTFAVSDDMSSGDKKVIKKRVDSPEGPKYELFNYIAKRQKGSYAYYRFESMDEQNNAVYTRIEPLGYKNSFIEYEYGNNANEIATVINKNRTDYNPNLDIMYDSYEPEIDYDSIPDYINTDFDLDARNEAYSQVFGTDFKESPSDSKNDIVSIEPNIDFKDEEGNPICGA